MKCQKCEKPAAFHITDLTGDDVLALHLCPDCAKEYLHPSPSEDSETPNLSSVLSKQLTLGKASEQLAELDQKECPMCGISFYDFRQSGRLGCPYDYTFFYEELSQLLINVHGSTDHIGKTPKHGVRDVETQTELIRLRREMKEAINQEDYEQASLLRDQIRALEKEGQTEC